MHELAMADRVVRLLRETVDSAGGRRAAVARLRVGVLSCLNPETLAFAFQVAARGTAAEGCVLEIAAVPARLECRGCGLVHGGTLLEPCPACGEAGARILEGTGTWLDSVEVEVEDGAAPACAGAAGG